MKFTMSEAETQKAKDWIQSQIKLAKELGIQNKDCTGFRFGYIFIPTSLGNCVKVRDYLLNKEIDVSDDF